MQVSVVPLTDFVHDRLNVQNGLDVRTGRPPVMDESAARELERRGLVRLAAVPRRVDQALAVRPGAIILGTEAGKAPDDGQGQPSSASHPAPVLAPTITPTLPASKRGQQRTLKVGR